jgi:hypothetical protein
VCCREKESRQKNTFEIYQEFLDAIEEVMGTGTTYATELDRLGKHMFGADWRGVYASDNVLPSNGCYIVNTDKKSAPGEHWMAVHNGYFYDSFGRTALLLQVREAEVGGD